MREIFRETIDRILPGNPLDHLDHYRELTVWSLIVTVDRWRDEGGRAAELSHEWGRIVRRELKWRLIFEDYYEFSKQADALHYSRPSSYVRSISAALPA